MEEHVNAWTHGLGVLLSLFGTGWLWLSGRDGTTGQRIACQVFGLSLIVLYLASTLYHSARRPICKRQLRVVDHVAIYLLIAGTYTPFLVAYVPGPWRILLLGVIWGVALAGMVFEGSLPDVFPGFPRRCTWPRAGWPC